MARPKAKIYVGIVKFNYIHAKPCRLYCSCGEILVDRFVIHKGKIAHTACEESIDLHSGHIQFEDYDLYRRFRCAYLRIVSAGATAV